MGKELFKAGGSRTRLSLASALTHSPFCERESAAGCTGAWDNTQRAGISAESPCWAAAQPAYTATQDSSRQGWPQSVGCREQREKGPSPPQRIVPGECKAGCIMPCQDCPTQHGRWGTNREADLPCTQ